MNAIGPVALGDTRGLARAGELASVERIMRRHGFTAAEVLSRDNHARIAFARHECVAYLRSKRDPVRPWLGKYSWPEIGAMINRDNATCMASARQFEIERELGYIPQWDEPANAQTSPAMLAVPWVTG